MKRRLFNGLAGLSLLLCVGAVTMWVRSCWQYDVLSYNGKINARLEQRMGDVVSESGRIVFIQITWHLNGLSKAKPGHGWSDAFGARSAFHVSPQTLGAGWFCWPWFNFQAAQPVQAAIFGAGAVDHMVVVIPYWMLALAFVLLPGFWVYRFGKSRHRRERGLCPGCGYDLRATPERCPECGRVGDSVESPLPNPPPAYRERG